MDLKPTHDWIVAQIDAAKAQIATLNAAADAAQPDNKPHRWPERDTADQLIAPLNRALANLGDALAQAGS